jgi:hypothetical protein
MTDVSKAHKASIFQGQTVFGQLHREYEDIEDFQTASYCMTNNTMWRPARSNDRRSWRGQLIYVSEKYTVVKKNFGFNNV